MSKYSFDRMPPEEFESMAQALLEATYRIGGNLIQFGDGKDGGREATWTQPPEHPTYLKPQNARKKVPKEWIFQVKYHDVSQRGWTTARDAVVTDLGKELEKIGNKYKLPCHAYVMITNVPFTGAYNVGTRDKITATAKKWRHLIPEIYIWDAADISRMLDANHDVRTAYLDSILPGDLLLALFKGANFRQDRATSAFRAYLKFVTEREGAARTEEAGDDPGLPLRKVFIDLTVSRSESDYEAAQRAVPWPEDDRSDSPVLPDNLTKVPASFSLFFADHPAILLLGGPGFGKSTLTQFVSLYHAARVVNPDLSIELAGRLKLPIDIQPQHLDSYCSLRFPFRVELRRYAQWINEQSKNQKGGQLARYIAESLVNPNVGAELCVDDIFALAAKVPLLLILDGLDEVPNPGTRQEILSHLRVFVRRVKAENQHIFLLFSSRPKGYAGEFNEFHPLTWELNELDREEFDEYCNLWLDERVRDADERREALDRISRGMTSDAVQRLASSLLQATVMLTIVKRKNEIPHQRHALYAKYVEVIFDREKEKWPVVRDRANELLRLHERVGYELHRKTERTGVESLDREAFRSYILDVLEDYSGDDLGVQKLREVADDIVEAATDRLCLLVGKGQNQTEIDFVVQSFREYFAATYLFNHPEADPNKVFTTLVERGAYWSNVLQFYAAQANANQQMRWVLNAENRGDEEQDASSFLERVAARRALLNVLPEFSLQRKADFDRALRVIFSKSTRWTWPTQRAAIDSLRIVRAGTTGKVIQEMFSPLSVHDNATLDAELDVLGRLIPNKSPEFSLFRSAVQSLVDNRLSAEITLKNVIEYDIDVDLSGSDTLAMQYVDSDDRRLGETLVGAQPPSKLVDLLLVGFEWGSTDDVFPASSSRITRLAATTRIEIIPNQVDLNIRPYLCRDTAGLEGIDAICEVGDMSREGGRYLCALLAAAKDPTSIEADQQARNMYSMISGNILQMWSPDQFLGPAPSQFSSLQGWRAFKHAIAEALSQSRRWIADDCHPATDWPMFHFHCDDWRALVKEGLVTNEDSARLKLSRIGRAFSLPTKPLDCFCSWAVSGRMKPVFPLFRFLNAAFDVIAAKGTNALSCGYGLDAVLLDREIEATNSADVQTMLRKSLAVEPLPSPHWVSAVLRLALTVPDVDVNLLIQFWQKHDNGKRVAVNIPGADSRGEIDGVLDKLLRAQSMTAFRLGLTIIAGCGATERIEDRFRERIASSLSDGSMDLALCLDSLCGMVPSIGEFSIWQREEWRRISSDDGWYRYALEYRFHVPQEARFTHDCKSAIKALLPFVVERGRYAPHIARAALESVLKLRVSEVPVLADLRWKSS
jgi:hypothetical protein